MAQAAIFVSRVLAGDAAPELQAEFIEPESAETKAVRDAGDYAIGRLGMTMVTEASSTVAQLGAVAALDTCHLKDVPMKNGTIAGMPRIVAMKITSTKVRNLANAPDAAEQAALARMQASLDAGTPLRTIVQRVTPPTGKPEWRVYKPLATVKHCLVCHGAVDEMPADLKTALQTKYPNDQATGYRDRELRGLIRVTVADAPPTPVPAAKPAAAPVAPKKSKA